MNLWTRLWMRTGAALARDPQTSSVPWEVEADPTAERLVRPEVYACVEPECPKPHHLFGHPHTLPDLPPLSQEYPRVPAQQRFWPCRKSAWPGCPRRFHEFGHEHIDPTSTWPMGSGFNPWTEDDLEYHQVGDIIDTGEPDVSDYAIPPSAAVDEKLALSILRKLVQDDVDAVSADIGYTAEEIALLQRLAGVSPQPGSGVDTPILDRDACRPSTAGVLWKTRTQPGVGGSGAAEGDRWEHPDTGARAVATAGGWVSL